MDTEFGSSYLAFAVDADFSDGTGMFALAAVLVVALEVNTEICAFSLSCRTR